MASKRQFAPGPPLKRAKQIPAVESLCDSQVCSKKSLANGSDFGALRSSVFVGWHLIEEITRHGYAVAIRDSVLLSSEWLR